MSEQSAASTMKSMAVTLTSRLVMRAAKTARAPEPDNKTETAFADAVEYWARRAMWVLVIVTCLWDIAVTFDRHFAATGRLL